ncbi:glycine-rich RNA-binding protein blt801-like [Trifolium pratense]|nr:glycine-rich RNA-binding protein blt801-like [Trifolium pratense]
MNSKGFLFLAMLLASILLISAEKSHQKDDKANGIDESKGYYGGGWGYGGPWRGGGWGYGGGPWRGGGWGYGGRGGGWGYGGRGGGWGGGYGGPWRGGGGWGGGWPKEHTDAEPQN